MKAIFLTVMLVALAGLAYTYVENPYGEWIAKMSFIGGWILLIILVRKVKIED